MEQPAGASSPPESHQLYKVAVCAQAFWPDEPEVWFAQLVGQFALGGITQDATKYAHVVSQLDYAREVKDLITNPPEIGKYNAIKQALIQQLSASREQRIRQLLEHEELGDRKPSQFLRHPVLSRAPLFPTNCCARCGWDVCLHRCRLY